jgi:hypothetical protein
MEIKVTFSLKLEEERIKFTLSKLKWYKKHGYNPLLPKKEIVEEYEEKMYESFKNNLLTKYSDIKENIENQLHKTGKPPTKIEVILTKYGTMGSYRIPDKVILNIHNNNPLKTLIHEIVHLMIEKKVIENKIAHEEKEKIVDKILKDNFSFLN